MAGLSEKDPMAKRLGQIIHEERLKQGYATADEFAEAIENATGLQVPKDSIQRAEAGRQWPKLTHYIGMAITLDMLYDPMLVQALPAGVLAHRAESMRAKGLEWRYQNPYHQPKTI